MRGDETRFREAAAVIARRPELSRVPRTERLGTSLPCGLGLEVDVRPRLARGAGGPDLDVARPCMRSPLPARTPAGPYSLLAVVRACRDQVLVPAVGFLRSALEPPGMEDRDGG